LDCGLPPVPPHTRQGGKMVRFLPAGRRLPHPCPGRLGTYHLFARSWDHRAESSAESLWRHSIWNRGRFGQKKRDPAQAGSPSSVAC